jgi:hypothetical protein
MHAEIIVAGEPGPCPKLRIAVGVEERPTGLAVDAAVTLPNPDVEMHGCLTWRLPCGAF